jgi:hypothetical protein
MDRTPRLLRIIVGPKRRWQMMSKLSATEMQNVEGGGWAAVGVAAVAGGIVCSWFVKCLQFFTDLYVNYR